MLVHFVPAKYTHVCSQDSYAPAHVYHLRTEAVPQHPFINAINENVSELGCTPAS